MIIIACDINGENSDALARAVAGAGFPVLRVPELYHVPGDSPLWARLAALPEPLVYVTGLHTRPSVWLLRRHGIQAEVVSLREVADHAEAFAAIGALHPVSAASCETLAGDAAARWYPVIDRDRCGECHHCLQFCLFGVYVLDADGRVTVENPDACKAGCPACSRICPHGAIIFPLYQDPAIAGAPGVFMSPDVAARRMYYTRTRRPCPTCGRTEAGVGGEICAECGRAKGARVEPDELDDLIAALDALPGRRP
ncbi:MAG: 2-ketoisovalerate ferredoxin oxidoreductase subunit delta [bacterium ADurb.Bin429]|nr:MAG: 2-ketoisovalerate ferredoxin oxidoreductase subunit delta [bacterium ADurb.Bin429]